MYVFRTSTTREECALKENRLLMRATNNKCSPDSEIDFQTHPKYSKRADPRLLLEDNIWLINSDISADLLE